MTDLAEATLSSLSKYFEKNKSKFKIFIKLGDIPKALYPPKRVDPNTPTSTPTTPKTIKKQNNKKMILKKSKSISFSSIYDKSQLKKSNILIDKHNYSHSNTFINNNNVKLSQKIIQKLNAYKMNKIKKNKKKINKKKLIKKNNNAKNVDNFDDNDFVAQLNKLKENGLDSPKNRDNLHKMNLEYQKQLIHGFKTLKIDEKQISQNSYNDLLFQGYNNYSDILKYNHYQIQSNANQFIKLTQQNTNIQQQLYNIYNTNKLQLHYNMLKKQNIMQSNTNTPKITQN